MNFMNAMQNEIKAEKTYTVNGATAYATSGKKLTDFYYAITGMRQMNEEEIKNMYTPVFFEDPMNAVKMLFQMRDCRGGNGERKIFRSGLVWLAENKPEIAKAVIPLVAEYGRWDDLWCLLDTSLNNDVCKFVKMQLEEDIEKCEMGRNISLLAKWLPSLNASSRKTYHYAEIIRNYLDITPRQYRKTLSKIRAYLDVVERKMSAKQWGDIDYATVPSQTNVKCSAAFLRNDRDRRREYLDSLVKGETKINASVLQPHEIVAKYVGGNGWYGRTVKPYDEALEQLWKAMPEVGIENCLVVRDGSGSMLSGYNTSVKPLDVATALAIRMAKNNKGIWKDKFITFSARPKIGDLSNCGTLHDMLVLTYAENDCTNTNIEATMMLVLDTAINNHCSQEDMPKTILILSDMQFDQATYGRVDISLFDNIAQRFIAAGYKMPKICFWNLSGRVNNTIPMQQNELGVILISGFSTQLANMVMSGKTDPYEVILEAINAPRYQPVEDAVKGII